MNWPGVLIVLGAAGCATSIDRYELAPASLVRASASATALRARSAMRIALEGGLPVRSIAKNSTWEPAGAIERGTVYRSTDSVFTVGSGNTLEAMLVVSGGEIAGVYLPTESAFVAARRPQPFDAGEN
jgi:hypothetical protein